MSTPYFLSAMKAVSDKIIVKVPGDTAIDSKASLGPPNGGATYGISVALPITPPGLDDAQNELLVDTAREVCLYSNATPGNIDVEITVA